MASEGGLTSWRQTPEGRLAEIIVLDQFPRNMYRDEGKAFRTDRAALAAAKSAIDRGWDLKIDEPARRFFYMPLMHSENLCDQDRCVRLMHERMPAHGAATLLHARAHREVIRQFGRFVSPTKVQAGDHVISARRFVIATGSRPFLPPIPGLDRVPFLTNESLFDLRERNWSTAVLEALAGRFRLGALTNGNADVFKTDAGEHFDFAFLAEVDDMTHLGFPIAEIDAIQWADALPRTRSGKILRNILDKIAAGRIEELGDTSVIADPKVIKNLIKERKKIRDF